MTLKNYLFKFTLLSLLFACCFSYSKDRARWISTLFFDPVHDTYLFNTLEFFIYDSIKILLLLCALVYVMGLARANLDTLKVKNFLAGKKRLLGYSLGSLFGAITPFCSCSSVPLFIGFTTAKIPVGITMAFLITSPILNQVAIVMMLSILGFKFTAIYIALGILCGILGGFFFDAIKAERLLQPFIVASMHKTQSKSKFVNLIAPKQGLLARHEFAKQETYTIVKKVYKWIFLGVALGACIHGFIPEDFFLTYAKADNLLTVPFAVFMGLPLYSNVTGIIPIMESLLLKGLPVGTTFAFCLSSVAASIPEFILLKQVMRWPMLTYFYAFLFVVFILIGYFFNLIF